MLRPVLARTLVNGRSTGQVCDPNDNQTSLCTQNKGSPGWSACFATTYDNRNRVAQLYGDFANHGLSVPSTEAYDGLGRFGRRANANSAASIVAYAGNVSRPRHIRV